MAMVRCMLDEKNLPKKFWTEAANTAVFLQNRLSSKALKDQTPFEVWYGFKPSLKFLKAFGCVYFAHVPQNKRDKLGKKAISGIFVGYSLVSKAYKVYHPQNGRMTITVNVHFNKEEQWDWNDSLELLQELSLPKKQLKDKWLEETIDDSPVRGTRPLSEIYQRWNIVVCEPAEHEEALKDLKWKKAMEEEMSMIQKNKIWELVDKPVNRKSIGVKWVFRTKLNADSSINKHKARLVVKDLSLKVMLRFLVLITQTLLLSLLD